MREAEEEDAFTAPSQVRRNDDFFNCISVQSSHHHRQMSQS
jgi:hypothetical protein